MDFLFYNVENLFDIDDNPRKKDNGFLPEGKLNWTQERFDKKLKDLSEVICNYNGTSNPPELIGLSEVENYKVVKQLISQPGLSSKNYKIIHSESKDQRGIDTCFVYNADFFDYKSHKMINIDRHSRNQLHSRDIMSIKGKLMNGSDLHILINHWPSRRDGEKLTRYKRSAAAETVKEEVEGIYSLEDHPKIIICGDFNDDPPSFSLNTILSCKKKSNNPYHLINLAWCQENNNEGTVNHDDRWYMFDQFIVSQPLHNRIADKRMNITRNTKTIYDGSAGPKPNRTYVGSRYTGGVSDHLPVWISFE